MRARPSTATYASLSAADSIKTAGVLLDTSLDVNREAFTEGEWKAARLEPEDHDGMTAGSILSRMRGPEYRSSFRNDSLRPSEARAISNSFQNELQAPASPRRREL